MIDLVTNALTTFNSVEENVGLTKMSMKIFVI